VTNAEVLTVPLAFLSQSCLVGVMIEYAIIRVSDGVVAERDHPKSDGG